VNQKVRRKKSRATVPLHTYLAWTGCLSWISSSRIPGILFFLTASTEHTFRLVSSLACWNDSLIDSVNVKVFFFFSFSPYKIPWVKQQLLVCKHPIQFKSKLILQQLFCRIRQQIWYSISIFYYVLYIEICCVSRYIQRETNYSRWSWLLVDSTLSHMGTAHDGLGSWLIQGIRELLMIVLAPGWFSP
jgi:hypothetical protein